MSTSPQPDNGSGSSGGGVRFGDFIHPEADTLFGKVDFAGMLAAFGKAGLVGFFTFLAGIALAFQQSIGNIFEAATAGWRSVGIAYQAVLADVQTRALAVAVSDLGGFEFLALPASAAAALGPALVISFVIALAWGFD